MVPAAMPTTSNVLPPPTEVLDPKLQACADIVPYIDRALVKAHVEGPSARRKIDSNGYAERTSGDAAYAALARQTDIYKQHLNQRDILDVLGGSAHPDRFEVAAAVQKGLVVVYNEIRASEMQVSQLAAERAAALPLITEFQNYRALGVAIEYVGRQAPAQAAGARAFVRTEQERVEGLIQQYTLSPQAKLAANAFAASRAMRAGQVQPAIDMLENEANLLAQRALGNRPHDSRRQAFARGVRVPLDAVTAKLRQGLNYESIRDADASLFDIQQRCGNDFKQAAGFSPDELFTRQKRLAEISGVLNLGLSSTPEQRALASADVEAILETPELVDAIRKEAAFNNARQQLDGLRAISASMTQLMPGRI